MKVTLVLKVSNFFIINNNLLPLSRITGHDGTRQNRQQGNEQHHPFF